MVMEGKTAMRYDWTFHCYAEGNYWECSIVNEDGKPKRISSEQSFPNRGEAIRDAKHNGLDAKSDAHIVVFKRYTT